MKLNQELEKVNQFVFYFIQKWVNGVDFMMGSHKWHGVAPNDEELANALSQNEETLGDY